MKAARANARGRTVRPRTNDEISEATRRRLLTVGRRSFARPGFAAVSADEIAAKAGLTRGALHYQFTDKKGLFRAVAADVVRELTEHVATETMRGPEGPEELERGCDILLQSFGTPHVQAIFLRDGPVVLGLEEWRRLQEESGLAALLPHALEHWVEAGWIAAERVAPLARILFGALMQAGVAIAEADDREGALALYRGEIRGLLRALRSS